MDDRSIARAIDSLRRGWPIEIGGVGLLAVETADDSTLARFDGRASDLILSGPRAATLKLANQIEGVPTRPVRIARGSGEGLAEAMAIADPARDLSTPFKGPFQALADADPKVSAAAIRLARLAGLLPAFFIGGEAGPDAERVSAETVIRFDPAASIRIASRARLPTHAAEKAEIVAFRAPGDASEHVALLIGAPSGEPPLVRIHSECLTGDALGSLKCDCGPQLDAALARIAEARWGILLYLRQEGRGIGLVNKLRAYALQDQGFDTVEANLRLGFGDDERDFAVAGAMLRALGQDKVRLLSNNPRKGDALAAAGITVLERVPLKAGANPHNQAYLDTKRDRSGHQL